MVCIDTLDKVYGAIIWIWTCLRTFFGLSYRPVYRLKYGVD